MSSLTLGIGEELCVPITGQNERSKTVIGKRICKNFPGGFVYFYVKKQQYILGVHLLYLLSQPELKKTTMIGEIHTEKGLMKIEFFEKDAPKTVQNFVKLSKEGFYDGLTFHRVIPNFVIQGGCPNGQGNGGPGYKIDCELDGENQYHDKGVLSMAHAGRNTGGSQFFVCHSRDNTAHLDRNHTCFGKVVEGLEVIDQISQGDTINKIVIVE